MAGRATLNFDCAGLKSQVVLNTFVGGLTAAQEAIQIRDKLWAQLRPFTANSQVLESILIGDLSTGHLQPVGEAGTAGTTQLPNHCAFLITKVVSGGRNGRMYWPGPIEANYDPSGQIAAPTRTNLNLALEQARLQLDAALVGLMVTDKNGVSRPVTNLIVQPTIGTQRRRLRN